MTFGENLSRLIQILEKDSHHEVDEIHELIVDASEVEIRASWKQFISLCHTLTEALLKTKRSVSGIRLMSSAIRKLQSHGSQLTPIHSDLTLLCLDAKCLHPALVFLEIDYTEIKTTDDKRADVRNLLLFYYYGGLIYAAMKNFERASFYFEVVLTTPALVFNPIMQESYKKYILMCLLIDGNLPENHLPKYTSTCVMKNKKQMALPYLKFASEYTTLSYEKINRIVEMNKAEFERDENMGLIKQCLTQVHRRNIQRLTKTFLTLPLKDVADHVGLATDKEAETYILNMIDDGEIFATINQKDGMVVFQDNPEKFDTTRVFQKLQEDMSVSTMLIQTLKKLDSESQHIETNKQPDTKSILFAGKMALG